MSNGHGPLYFESTTTGGYIYTCDCEWRTGEHQTTDDALIELSSHLRGAA